MRNIGLLLAMLVLPAIAFSSYNLWDFTGGGATHAEGGNYEVWGSCGITCGEMSDGNYVLNGGYFYVGVDDYFPGTNPIVFSLSQNYPNPFSNKTSIRYSLPKPGFVKIQVFNIRGQLIEAIVDKFMQSGSHTVEWNAKDMSSGIYFYKLTTDYKTFIKKMIILH